MDFAQRTVDIARRNVAEGGRPFASKTPPITVTRSGRDASGNDGHL
jgi:hypothetical protein